MQASPTTTTPDDSPADFPALVSGWLAETLPEVETAIHDGSLEEVIDRPQVREVLGPQLGKIYRSIITEKTRHDALFRAPWIARFLRDLKQSLQPPTVFFPVVSVHGKILLPKDGAAPPPIGIAHNGEEIILRPDQVISVRSWGIWFTFENEWLERIYLAATVRHAVSRLVKQMRNLRIMDAMPTSARATFRTDPEWHSDAQFQFGRLVIDLLNESAPVAQEVVDPPELLLSLPTIQLKSGSHLHLFAEAGLPPRQSVSQGPYVTVAPFELARFALSEAANGTADENFWSAWVGEDPELHRVAERLRDLFAEAIASPPTHPLGPLALLSPPVRELIRGFPLWRARANQPEPWIKQFDKLSRTVSRRVAAPAAPADHAEDPGVFARHVGEAIRELETSLAEGSLLQRIEKPELQYLVGPLLTERYRSMATEPLQHNPIFRANWINLLLEEFQAALHTPIRTFPATASSQWTPQDPTPPSLTVVRGPINTFVRPDQVLSARSWGTGFTFDDKDLERFYTAFIVHRALNRLASNIKFLWNIEATFLSGNSKLTTEPQWRQGKASKFEHLMIDVLNEETATAVPAPLAEDILERTDLRVYYPGIKRKEGSRVQVSLTAIPELHDNKVRTLFVPDEYIILTPVELARSAKHPPAHPLFENFPWDDFWSCFGGKLNIHDLAWKLYDLFHEAISFPPRHPLGPMWHLAPVLRWFIRIYTQHRAEKSTDAFYERQKTVREIDSVHKYTSAYWRDKFSQPAPEKKTG